MGQGKTNMKKAGDAGDKSNKAGHAKSGDHATGQDWNKKVDSKEGAASGEQGDGADAWKPAYSKPSSKESTGEAGVGDGSWKHTDIEGGDQTNRPATNDVAPQHEDEHVEETGKEGHDSAETDKSPQEVANKASEGEAASGSKE